MIIFDVEISDTALDFFQKYRSQLSDLSLINNEVKKVCGINSFFTSADKTLELLAKIDSSPFIVSEPNRREYGDFQTNNILANQVLDYIKSKFDNIEFILEPTCGKGSFILASIQNLVSLQKVIGVEIHEPYVWEAKFNILTFYLENPRCNKPEIDIVQGNAFEFNYEKVANETSNLKTLVVGNPPWITNSELGLLESINLPQKSNFKNHRGLDALTGKGNFDIGEYITLLLLKIFQNHNGIFAFLIKNSVVKNIIQEQKVNCFRINHSEKLNIDSKKEFDVSVSACLYLTHLNNEPDYICKEYDFYTREFVTTFGWYKDKYVNSVEDYDYSSIIDGKSKFIWRSGVKHDCSKVMEIEKVNGHYINGFGEEFKLENNLIYGLLKSSDLKSFKTNSYRKQTIITQNKIGQDTKYIKYKYPLTHNYLLSHKAMFSNRKSSIYKDKPDFSIFGIGDYSFSNYKVAISGLYKSTHFTLVTPNDSKPLMLDDTCYFIGFNKLIYAEIAHFLLNSDFVQKFLKSIIFSDSKRSINKDILMRIDFEKAFDNLDYNKAKLLIPSLELENWSEFGFLLKNEPKTQIELF